MISLLFDINFLNPMAWWGLLGLVIPIAIHLLSKREIDIVSFGSLQFLRPLESESARSIQLSQYALLALRMLLIASICYLLADPVIEKEKDRTLTYWVSEQIYKNSDFNTLVQSIPEDADINLFSHEKTNDLEVKTFASSWTLIHYLNSLKDSSIVYSHSLQSSFKGKPVPMKPQIDWKIVPQKEINTSSESFIKNSISTDWYINASHTKLSVTSTSKDSNEAQDNKLLSLQFLSDETSKEANQLKEIINLSVEELPYDIEWINESSTQTANWQIVVASENAKTANSIAKNQIIWQPTKYNLEIERIDESKLQLTGKIDQENILETNLPVIISSLLNKDITSVVQHDIRSIHPKEALTASLSEAEQNLTTHSTTANAQLTYKNPVSIYLLLLILPLFLIERFYSYKLSDLE